MFSISGSAIGDSNYPTVQDSRLNVRDNGKSIRTRVMRVKCQSQRNALIRQFI